jgi:hypothetical protein
VDHILARTKKLRAIEDQHQPDLGDAEKLLREAKLELESIGADTLGEQAALLECEVAIVAFWFILVWKLRRFSFQIFVEFLFPTRSSGNSNLFEFSKSSQHGGRGRLHDESSS